MTVNKMTTAQVCETFSLTLRQLRYLLLCGAPSTSAYNTWTEADVKAFAKWIIYREPYIAIAHQILSVE